MILSFDKGADMTYNSSERDAVPDGTPAGPGSESMRARRHVDNPVSLDDVQIPPESRYRWRMDGGRDETYRVNFVGALSPSGMRQITELLLTIVDESKSLGITALTKIEFVEPDTCEYCYRCSRFTNDRVNKMFELWHRLNQIHRVRNIDGVAYSQYFPEPRAAPTESDIP